MACKTTLFPLCGPSIHFSKALAAPATFRDLRVFIFSVHCDSARFVVPACLPACAYQVGGSVQGRGVDAVQQNRGWSKGKR